MFFSKSSLNAFECINRKDKCVKEYIASERFETVSIFVVIDNYIGDLPLQDTGIKSDTGVCKKIFSIRKFECASLNDSTTLNTQLFT